MKNKKVRPAVVLFLVAIAAFAVTALPRVAANSVRSADSPEVAPTSVPVSHPNNQRPEATEIETARNLEIPPLAGKASPRSLTQRLAPSHSGALLVSTFKTARVSDEPQLLILLGVALIGIAHFLRRIS
jgi:hypothetical protein